MRCRWRLFLGKRSPPGGLLYLIPQRALGCSLDAADGGALRVYPAHAPRSTTEHVMDIPPDGGTLVLLDSAAVEHAVLETHRERQCVVGWFREGRSIRVPDRDEMSLRTKYW